MTFPGKLTIVAAMGQLLVFSLLLLSRPFPQTTALAPAELDFSSELLNWEEKDALSRVNTEIRIQLLPGQRKLSELVKQAQQTEAVTPTQALSNFHIFVRAGMYEESLRAILDLKRLQRYPSDLGGIDLFAVRGWQLDQPNLAPEVAELFCNAFRGRTSADELLDRLVTFGWTTERVDKCLAELSGASWMTKRLMFNERHGRGKECRLQLEDDIRRNPRNTRKAIDFLTAIRDLSSRDQDPREFDWIGDVVQPRLATEAREIATLLWSIECYASPEELEGPQKPSTAAKFFRIAMSIPLTAREIFFLGSGGQSGTRPSDADVRARFSAILRSDLAECLTFYNEDSTEAKQLILEEKVIAKQNDVGYSPELSPEEAAVALAADETLLLAAEQSRSTDPEYWLDRARHFSLRRKDSVQAKHACVKGLAVAPAVPFNGGKGASDPRRKLLTGQDGYVGHLQQEDRHAEATELLWKEISDSPPLAESSIGAALRLASDYPKQVAVEKAVLWKWLDGRPEWRDNIDGRMLETMLLNLELAEWEDILRRAETMTSGKHPSRALVMGRLEVKLTFLKRAIPLLDYAAATTDDRDLKHHAVIALIELHLKLTDWKSAERAIGDILRLYPINSYEDGLQVPDWLTRAAVLAAKAGDRGDAIRLWRQVANIDLTNTKPVEQLVEAGLQSELIVFYEEMRATFATSDVPPKILEAIR